jgi:hypothetical protein
MDYKRIINHNWIAISTTRANKQTRVSFQKQKKNEKGKLLQLKVTAQVPQVFRTIHFRLMTPNVCEGNRKVVTLLVHVFLPESVWKQRQCTDRCWGKNLAKNKSLIKLKTKLNDLRMQFCHFTANASSENTKYFLSLSTCLSCQLRVRGTVLNVPRMATDGRN